MDRLSQAPRRLTNTPEQRKTHVKLSADKSRIAYLNDAGTPVIIRSDDGKHIKTLTQYSPVRQMEWARDRNTLILLLDNSLFSDGEPITLPQPQTTYPFPYDAVISFSMNSIGDYGYFTEGYGRNFPFLTYASKIKGVENNQNSFEGDYYHYIDFYDNKGGFLLAQEDPYYPGFRKVVCTREHNSWSAYKWDSETMTSPQFNADLEILLYGTVKYGIYELKAVYLGTEAYEGHGTYDVLSRVLSDYRSNLPIYLDWSY